MPAGSSLVETISLELGAQEPWPNDVKLFQPYAVEQILLPDNANCLAVQAFLHMSGLPFQIEHRANAEFMSPSGKVPFIKCGAFVISELEPIVQFVGNKGISLTSELDREQKADMRAYMSIIHTVLMNAELYICWVDEKTYNDVTLVRNGSVYPWPLNYIHTWSKRNSIIKWLKIHGWYQKSLQLVYEEVEICCKALSERLEGKEYFFGDKPTELDALLYGHIFAILSNMVPSNVVISIIMKYPNLIRHCYKICNEYMPHTSVIFTEKPSNEKFPPFDYNEFKEKQLEIIRSRDTQSKICLTCGESSKSCHINLKAGTDSYISRNSKDSSITLSENLSNFDYSTNESTPIGKSEIDLNVNISNEQDNGIKRTKSILNCCAFPDKNSSHSGII